ncbi:hypothetical protein JCM11641_007267 [Rhodosporidiobolus odoratus]
MEFDQWARNRTLTNSSPTGSTLPSLSLSLSPSTSPPELDLKGGQEEAVACLVSPVAVTSGAAPVANVLAQVQQSNSESSNRLSSDCASSKATRNRRKSKSSSSSPDEPSVALRPLTTPAMMNGQEVTVLVDSGADGHSVRLGLYGVVDLQVGSLASEPRSFFISSLPSGIDAILGVPWLGVSGAAVSARKVFLVPDGPSEDIVDFSQDRFRLQPQANFNTLGFTQREMTGEEQHQFVLCAIKAGAEGLDDYVDYEPHNPLLDEDDDDPLLPDISAEEAEAAVQALLERFSDVLVSELPNRLPPHRPEDHSIDLLDEEVKVKPRAINIPARYDQQWRAHVRKFVDTGYWAPAALESACSMFAVPKHDRSQARFVINLKPRNANTRKRVSPIPDMKAVRFRVASRRYRSKLDFKNAYEQIRLILEAHLRYLEVTFQTLRHYKFFLSKTKVDLLAPRLEALGAIIDDNGISVDPSKMDAIRQWPVPRNPKDILRFMGTAQWLSDHLPHLKEMAAPLTRLTSRVDWEWTPACDLAFNLIKQLIPQTLVPLDLAKLESGEEKLFLFSDASWKAI